MDYRNETHLEPGTYVDASQRVVVLVDFITHEYNSVADMVEALVPNYSVVVRPLEDKIHVRELYPREVFKSKFKKV